MAEETPGPAAEEISWDRSLERWWPQVRWAAARLAYRIFPRLAAAALEIDAAGLRAEGIPQLFARDLKEIDPRLNDDLLELYGRSEQVLNNHFGFFGRTQKFGAEIDWEPPESPAWRRELHACDYAFDLALTCRISGEERYARHLRYLFAHWIASNPPVRGSGWHPHAVARRVRNWVLAADLARADWEGDREFCSLLNQSLALQSGFLFHHASSLVSSTELLDASRSLLLSHRFFGEKSEFRAAARQLLLQERELPGGKEGGASPLPEGWPTERLHRAYTLMEWLLFDTRSLPALRQAQGGERSRTAQAARDANWLQEELRQALASLEAVLMPGGSLPLLGSAARTCADELSDLAALAAVMFSDLASTGWKALAGHFGILPYMLLGEKGKAQFAARAEAPPETRPACQDCGEFYRLNASDSSTLLVSARFPSLPNDHCDFLSWELTTQENRVVVDSGGYSPDEADYFPSAWAHNVLLVDGQASQPRGARIPAAHWKSGTGYAGLMLPDSGFRSRGLNHERAWFRLEGGAWVVLDRLEGRARRGGPRCLSLLHFYPAFELLVNDQHAVARSRACTITLFPLGQTPVRQRAWRGAASGSERPGWYSPDFGMRYPASVLAMEWDSVRLPWIGGLLIVPGEGAAFRMLDCPGNRVSFEWSGKQYALEL